MFTVLRLKLPSGSSMSPKKKARTSTNDFDPAELYAEWKPLAELKKPGFSWTGDDYEKTRRGQGPDRNGLKLYAKGLTGLFKVAPSCYPRHSPLRDTLTLLHHKHNILDPSVVVKPGWADKGADKWSIMMKHLLDESKSKKRTGHEELDALLDKVREPLCEADHGSDEVEIVSFKCGCKECRKLCAAVLEAQDNNAETRASVGSSEAGDEKSESSQAAAAQAPMDPVKGGHKKAILDKKPAGSGPDGSQKQKVQLVERKKGKKECYIMVDSHFWVGCSENQTTAYKQIITGIKAAVKEGLVTSKDEAIKMKTKELKKLREE